MFFILFYEFTSDTMDIHVLITYKEKRECYIVCKKLWTHYECSMPNRKAV